MCVPRTSKPRPTFHDSGDQLEEYILKMAKTDWQSKADLGASALLLPS